MSKTALIDLLYASWQRGGPVSRVDMGSAHAVLVTGATEARRVLVQEAELFTKSSHRARVLLGDGLITATGEQWKRQRKALQAHFTAVGVRRYERHIGEAAQVVARRWDAGAADGAPVDVAADMRYFALDTIWRLLTGTPLDARTHEELGAIDRVVAALPTTGSTGAELPDTAADLAAIDAVAGRAIEAARAAGPEAKTGILHDLLDHPDTLLRDELVTLIVAGHETTATTLTWLQILLGRHPQYREWALREGPAGLHALVSEAMRLFPAIWLVPRQATADTELGGVPITAGTRVLVCPYLTHRDPALWPAPTSFDPTRFTTGGRPAPGAYHPFGAGPRACLGQHFSLREMRILLEALLPHYRPRFTGPPPPPAFAATLRPDGPLLATLDRPAG